MNRLLLLSLAIFWQLNLLIRHLLSRAVFTCAPVLHAVVSEQMESYIHLFYDTMLPSSMLMKPIFSGMVSREILLKIDALNQCDHHADKNGPQTVSNSLSQSS